METNTGITLVDVRSAAMETIRKLQNGEIDVKTAGEIRNLCNTVIDVAKTQVEYIKAIPNHVKDQITLNEVKAIAGTLIDRDSELDKTLFEIESSNGKPYSLTSSDKH